MRNFGELLAARQAEGRRVCVGLDSDYEKIPAFIRDSARRPEEAIVAFNKAIIEATKDIACAYKPNAAFYEACGYKGLMALGITISHIHAFAPGVPVILDYKRGDIGNTNAGYVKEAFVEMGADAITVHPYLGGEALQPFLEREDRGVFVLCRTSNPGAGEFQDVVTSGGWPLYKLVAYRVASIWPTLGNCRLGLVVGATYPDELREVRELVGDEMPILIPGLGAQGGDTERTVLAGAGAKGKGVMIINASRSIIFASPGEDFAEAARAEALRMHEEINGILAGVAA